MVFLKANKKKLAREVSVLMALEEIKGILKLEGVAVNTHPSTYMIVILVDYRPSSFQKL